MEKSILDNLVFGNRAAVVCVLFTIVTMLDLIVCVSIGISDISYSHLSDRFILCIAVSVSLLVFRYFEKLSLLAILLIHFFICILMMLAYTWISGLLRETLHPNAYRDAVRTIFIIYPVIMVGGLAIDCIKTVKANRILKKNQRT